MVKKKEEVEKIENEEKEIISEEEKEIAAELKEAKSDSNKYYEGLGRRKTAIARVRLYTKKKEFLINDKDYKVYFPIAKFQKILEMPFEKMKCLGKFGFTAKVSGGGFNAQAEAIRLGISRALVGFNADFKKRLRRTGFLTRDSRKVERKKYGLKKARRAPQWSKR